MGAPTAQQASPAPPPSALQSFLTAHPPPPTSTSPSHHHLALQIAHNLHYQHLWTQITLHTHSPTTNLPLPRPLLSGLPPQRLYVHPDEQIALLQAQKEKGKSGMPDLAREREWVLPSHLRERWSLRRFGEVFDGVTATVPSSQDVGAGGGRVEEVLFGELPGEVEGDGDGDGDDEEAREESEEHQTVNEWREKSPKRVLLATLDDDSTVVYYIVHDGIVKPRQN